jgi:hypothetical protein
MEQGEMNKYGMMVYCESAAGNVCFSLPGLLPVVPVRFSSPVPMLNNGCCLSVFAGIRSDFQLLPGRIEHFFISVAGSLVSSVKRQMKTAVRFFHCRINVYRSRIMKLAVGGRRL